MHAVDSAASWCRDLSVQAEDYGRLGFGALSTLASSHLVSLCRGICECLVITNDEAGITFRPPVPMGSYEEGSVTGHGDIALYTAGVKVGAQWILASVHETLVPSGIEIIGFDPLTASSQSMQAVAADWEGSLGYGALSTLSDEDKVALSRRLCERIVLKDRTLTLILDLPSSTDPETSVTSVELLPAKREAQAGPAALNGELNGVALDTVNVAALNGETLDTVNVDALSSRNPNPNPNPNPRDARYCQH